MKKLIVAAGLMFPLAAAPALADYQLEDEQQYDVNKKNQQGTMDQEGLPGGQDGQGNLDPGSPLYPDTTIPEDVQQGSGNMGQDGQDMGTGTMGGQNGTDPGTLDDPYKGTDEKGAEQPGTGTGTDTGTMGDDGQFGTDKDKDKDPHKGHTDDEKYQDVK